MRTYAHLRREHSIAQAQKVNFGASHNEAGRCNSVPGDGMPRATADADARNPLT